MVRRRLPEQAGQDSAGFLTRRQGLAQVILRLFERCFLAFPSLAHFGELCLDLVRRSFVVERLLQILDLMTGLVAATVAPFAVATLIVTAAIATTTPAAAAPTESTKAHSHARLALGVHYLPD